MEKKMRRKSCLALLLAVMLAFPVKAFAKKPNGGAEAAPAPTAKEAAGYDWGKVAALGSGVQNVRLDRKGRVTSFVVVGEARISKALGIAKGKKLAAQRARLNAKAEVMKWMQERVASLEQEHDETIIQMKGDGDALTEEGKSVEHNLAKIESYADGIIRGMVTLYQAVEEADGSQMFRIVLGWSAKNSQAAAQVREAMTAPPKKGKPKKETGATPAPAAPAQPRQERKKPSIPAQSATSLDTAEFE